jgi:hypothetical protein
MWVILQIKLHPLNTLALHATSLQASQLAILTKG